MVARFENLAQLAAQRSPQNAKFFEFALGYARQHLQVVQTCGRFPHRNAILGRTSTPSEIELLEREGNSF
jgi:uncharacterized protein (DUF924 family)